MKSRIHKWLASAVIAGSALAAAGAGAGVQYLGLGSFAWDARDMSGLTNTLEDGVTPNNLIGMGSGLAYAGGTRFIGLPDRGPNANSYFGGAAVDNTQSYQTRFQELDLGIVKSGANWVITPSLAKTTLLTNAAGQPLTGLSKDPVTGFANRFDPEAVQVSRSGKSVFISDEYGPSIRQFNRSTGQLEREISVPAKFLATFKSGVGSEELPKCTGGSCSPANPSQGNTSGRQANRGMEGLAISPDGSTLFGIMQSPLIQDSALNTNNQRRGVNNRILQLDVATGTTREFVYQLDNRSNGVNEIIAINNTQFLVIERDGNGGTGAAVKKIYKIDIGNATDVSNVASLPQTGTPVGVSNVTKSLFLDLLNPVFGLAGASFPEKIEGLSFGYDVFDGANWLHTLIVTNDNDFLENQPLNFYVFGFTDTDLPGLLRQQIPEPGGLALVGLGLAGLMATRRRKLSL